VSLGAVVTVLVVTMRLSLRVAPKSTAAEAPGRSE
jgi:hypothetical protein